jgi:flavodoxin I
MKYSEIVHRSHCLLTAQFGFAKSSYGLLPKFMGRVNFVPKILVLYYSQTGNTEKMAKAIAEGAKSAGNVEVELSYHVDVEDLGKFDAVLVGAPTYHHDMTMDTKKLFEEAAAKGISLKGKVGAAFGSYGWSGEAPKLVLEIMRNKFEMRVTEQPLLAKYVPDQNTLNMCRNLGKHIAESLIHAA